MGSCISDRREVLEMKMQQDKDGKEYSKLVGRIESYTKGLKTQLRNSMEHLELDGVVKKMILESGGETLGQNNPIYTYVEAVGKTWEVEGFLGQINGILEKGIERKIDIANYPQPDKKFNPAAKIERTDPKIATRKGSDAGQLPKRRGDIEIISKSKAHLLEKTRKMMDTISGIPILADYAQVAYENLSITVKETSRVIHSAVSLFHPFGVQSFPLYQEDGPSVLKACLEWKLAIPYDNLELFTMSGLPLTDVDTMQKERNCIFVDDRVTKFFFSTANEMDLRNKMETIIKEPFVFHKMALLGMTSQELGALLQTMSEELALELLKSELSVSGIVALRILGLFCPVKRE